MMRPMTASRPVVRCNLDRMIAVLWGAIVLYIGCYRNGLAAGRGGAIHLARRLPEMMQKEEW
jgi:hypothetical protein